MMNENEITDKQREILLIEYQACQNESHYYGTTYWTIVGIFLSFITAIAAFIVKNVLETDNALLDSNSNERWVIMGLSLLAIAIILVLGLWLKRTDKFMAKANVRGLEIAEQLKIKLNFMLKKIQDKGTPLKGHCYAIILFILASIPWIFLAIISTSPCVKDLILR